MEISAIILAAGNSSRLGRAKQLLTFKGKSLIQRCLANLIEVEIPNPVVVLGARFMEIKSHISEHFPHISTIENPDWEQGMASSLQKGLSLIDPKCEAVLICLSDQPLIPTKHLHEMIETFRTSEKIIVSAYNKGIGVPAIIPARYIPELKKLEGERGAKYVLNKYRSEAIELSCPEAAFDIDTEEDYRRIVEMN